MRYTRNGLLVLALVLAGLGLRNEVLVAGPVRTALAEDPRNSGLTLRARYGYYVAPGTLVLDLREAQGAAPVDVWRGLMQSAATLADAGRTFERVELAWVGAPVYAMDGDDFQELGRDFSVGENPIYLIRTLPEKLHHPVTGEAAFGTWTGGWLGVLSKQMEDANRAAVGWASGTTPTSTPTSDFGF